MELILCTHEEMESSMSHGALICSPDYMDDTQSRGAILCTQEELEQYYLMHWRTKGSKNGIRRYQDESGRLTPEGYQHYAEMYGWNKRLKRAERLQDRADEKEERAKSKAIAADEALLKSHKADLKNERRSTARRQRKADLMKTRKEEADAAAATARTDARKAQDKATHYADKLQRKDDKMAKYVDENGMLNEKALNKYTYTTGVPGERKMSLVGRMKFGNEYSDKFNKEYKSGMTKDEEKASEKKEKEKFDKDIREEHMDRAVAKDDLNAISKEAKRRLSEKGIKNPDFETVAEEMGKIRDEVYSRTEKRDPYAQMDADIESYSGKYGWSKENQRDILSEFNQGLDAMRTSERKRFGNGLLNCLDTVEKEIQTRLDNNEKIDKDEYKEFDIMGRKLAEEIYERSGSWNAEDFKKGSNAEKAYPKMSKAYSDLLDREDTIKREKGLSNIHDINDYKFLQKALKEDKVWASLNKAAKSADSDMCGAILKDLGFPDNSINRSIIFRYAYLD